MKKKPIIMYAVFSSQNAERPHGLFNSRWKASDGMRSLWNVTKTAYIKRVYVIQTGITHFDIYEHSIKRI